MSLKLTQARQSGFTIVELLIVVVVIAILAAITIVSYNGITTQANASAARSTANTVQKKVELYHSTNSSYPTTPAQLNDASKPYHLTTGFVVSSSAFSTANPTPENGKNTVKITTCAGNGLRITYYDYENNNVPSTPQITMGSC